MGLGEREIVRSRESSEHTVRQGRVGNTVQFHEKCSTLEAGYQCGVENLFFVPLDVTHDCARRMTSKEILEIRRVESRPNIDLVDDFVA
ncbi:MAG: hypothetical protein DWQ36_18200 [Acidobacteria bacterium]|nr:MAG: hypothetical protein DWQ30_15350 [Acidobacteriota bacterium]REK04363.1 MAG: hypothetical protein DWQ36_18200 [Acidobacteriota bacterium]